MLKKTFLVAFLAFFSITAIDYIFVYRSEAGYKKGEFFWELLIRYYAYSIIPILGGLFLVLLIFNRLFKKRVVDKGLIHLSSRYFQSSFVTSLLIIVLVFFIFQADRSNSISKSVRQNITFAILLATSFFLNWLIVWGRFKTNW